VIIDSSVIVAVLPGEPDADPWMTRLRSEFGRLRMSAATYVEAAAVLDRARSPVVSRKFDLFLETFGIEICPVTPEQAQIAREAYRDFGRIGAPRQPELRRLLLLRPGQRSAGGVDVQERRLQSHRPWTG